VTIRSCVSLIVVLAFAAFMAVVYLPQLGERRTFAALSILSDCSDARTAHVTVRPAKDRAAMVEISLLDAQDKASSGSCTRMMVQFPGTTGDEEILSPPGSEAPLVPNTDLASRLKRGPGIGDGDELSLDLAGSPAILPVVRFRWLDATTREDFATDRINIPLAPISINGLSLTPVRHLKVDLAVPNDLENASLSPTPNATLPLGMNRLDEYDFPSGVSVITLKWTNSIRSAIKEIGAVVLSLLAGAAISDFVTAPRKEKQSAAINSSLPAQSVRRGKRGKRT
jgi:hypothetical protein